MNISCQILQEKIIFFQYYFLLQWAQAEAEEMIIQTKTASKPKDSANGKHVKDASMSRLATRWLRSYGSRCP